MRNVDLLVIVMFFLCGTASAERGVWYVHPDSALNTIQAGLDACADHDIVLVAPATYMEHIVWPNTQGIHLISELGSEVTIIDGNDAGIVIRCTTGVDTATIIQGFTIQNGRYSGIRCTNNSSPTIRGNTIANNVAGGGHMSGGAGGGIHCGTGCSPIISCNTITDNSAVGVLSGGRGGGIACVGSQAVIIDNVITNNYAGGGAPGRGGGIGVHDFGGIIIGNSITGNDAATGGGIYCDNSSPTIDSCTIAYNSNGGVYCDIASSLEIHYCDIFDNVLYGVCNADPGVTVDAESNWWGDATGPYHPTANPGGLGDTVSDYVDFESWLSWPVGVEEQPVVRPVEKHKNLTANIFRGPLQLPEGKQCKVYDITGRVVEPRRVQPGIYFIEVDGVVTQKVVKVR